jgi:hypothetical protein
MTPEIKSSNLLTALSAAPTFGPAFTAINQARMQKQVRKLKPNDFIPESFKEMKRAARGLSNDATIAGESAAMEGLDRDVSEMTGSAMASGMDAATVRALLKNANTVRSRGRQKLRMAGAEARERRLGNYMNVLGKEAQLQDNARKEISGMYSALEGAKQANAAKVGNNITEAALIAAGAGAFGPGLKSSVLALKGKGGAGAYGGGGVVSMPNYTVPDFKYESKYGL